MTKPTFLIELEPLPVLPAINSRVVLGCAGLGGAWGPVNQQESVETILYALENNIQYLDTAPAYSESEKYVGQALQEWKGERPFISTKVGKLKSEAAWIDRHDFSPPALRRSLLNSLETLGVNKINLLFLHEPHVVEPDCLDEVLDTLLAFKSEGLVDTLGLGGNPDKKWLDKLTQIPGQPIEVLMLFNRLNACNLDALATEIPLMQSLDLQLYAASPLHMGLLGNRYAEYLASPPPWVSAKDLENARRAKNIADKYGLPLSNLAHRFVLSMAEVNRMVCGPSDLKQLQSTLHDYQQGILPEYIFQELAESIT